MIYFDKMKFSNVFYNGFTPANIPSEFHLIYLIMFQAIRACALLHDIGHPPFSHITEYAINNVYEKVNIKPSKTNRECEFLDILNQYELNKKTSQLHEKMGNKMTDKMVSDLLYGSSEWYKNKTFEEKYFKILVFEIVKRIFEEKTPVLRMLHGIVDGVLDGDRLDYVNRDILNSGINNGQLEYDRLISSMKILKENGEYFFISSTKTVNTVEDFFFKRWNLYKNIVYHHRVIKTDSLLQSCIENIIQDYLEKNDSIPHMPKDYVLPYDISGLWKAIKIANSNIRYFNSLIQWDDGWLFAVLKKHYFEDYYEKNSVTKFQLEELLSNRKNFFSIIKNSSDFDLLSKNFQSVFESYDFYKTPEFQRIEEILNGRGNNVSILYKLEAYFEAYYKGLFDFKEFVKENILDFISNNYDSVIEHQIIVCKSISSGLKTEPNIYKNNEVIPLSRFSNIKKILESEKYIISYFYIYIKFKSLDYYSADFSSKFLEELGSFLAAKAGEYLKNL